MISILPKQTLQGEVVLRIKARFKTALAPERQQALAQLAQIDDATAARIIELEAALSDEELARQQALAQLASLDESTQARIDALEAQLSQEQLAFDSYTNSLAC